MTSPSLEVEEHAVSTYSEMCRLAKTVGFVAIYEKAAGHLWFAYNVNVMKMPICESVNWISAKNSASSIVVPYANMRKDLARMMSQAFLPVLQTECSPNSW